ncbi:hypothetical protein AZ034_000697, partial [Pluralibacter gergoviae]
HRNVRGFSLSSARSRERRDPPRRCTCRLKNRCGYHVGESGGDQRLATNYPSPFQYIFPARPVGVFPPLTDCTCLSLLPYSVA